VGNLLITMWITLWISKTAQQSKMLYRFRAARVGASSTELGMFLKTGLEWSPQGGGPLRPPTVEVLTMWENEDRKVKGRLAGGAALVVAIVAGVVAALVLVQLGALVSP
jgi:hypothetical protein